VEVNEVTELGESITGTVEKITYRNDANAYTVAVVNVEKELLTVVGTMQF